MSGAERIGLRSEDSTIGAFADEVLELIRRSRFASPTGPLIGCILLSLGLAFQEHLVRGNALSTCNSHIEIASASDACHVDFGASSLRMEKTLVDDWIDASWLGVVKTLEDDWINAAWLGIIRTSVNDWIDSAVAYFLDVRIFSANFWLEPSSLIVFTSLSKIPTDSSVTRGVRALLMIELRLRDVRSSMVNDWWNPLPVSE